MAGGGAGGRCGGGAGGAGGGLGGSPGGGDVAGILRLAGLSPLAGTLARTAGRVGRGRVLHGIGRWVADFPAGRDGHDLAVHGRTDLEQ
ncbi:hypothetical protein E5F05_12285 [Deinococcus metallilatus]|uniref:Uncharacterized protein n=1 Tax=Deinococcus metallilatus TaxID=1211322 RepID=A0AAJ5JYA4_9DEIO|nr:hypothetical protein E5F05_12285 [Deinococcus metallilatus]RXJ10527.1 hypothetical protein ERJ73_11115 [Deinococcus metallilatus]TLK26498.1 hypothetical protein FCS05_10865 [Deinococcus metallilatus]